MGSNLSWNITAGFKAVEAWQQNIVRNAQGLLQPGYNRMQLNLNGSPDASTPGSAPTGGHGGRSPSYGGGDSLMVGRQSIEFAKGDLLPDNSPTSLAIKGDGFFVLVENLQPGARTFVTRAGNFHYDAQGRLVNANGLFVVGGSGTLSDPATPVTNPGDGSVDLTKITLARVPAPANLTAGPYAPTVYALNNATGSLVPMANGKPQVGFVQANTLEFYNRTIGQTELTIESTQATQTYKMFKELLDDYNKTVDDANSLVR